MAAEPLSPWASAITPALGSAPLIGYYNNITKCCTNVCPEHITITDNAIPPLKERVVDDVFDPVTRVLRVLTARIRKAT